MNKEIDSYISAAPAEQKAVMKELRKLIHQAIPGAEEHFKWGRPVFSLDKDFVYLKSAKSYVTLGFFHFEKLQDPNGLLEGTGKDMRHIKIKKAADIDSKLLVKWFKALVK